VPTVPVTCIAPSIVSRDTIVAGIGSLEHAFGSAG
jgi:hypothetical protein